MKQMFDMRKKLRVYKDMTSAILAKFSSDPQKKNYNMFIIWTDVSLLIWFLIHERENTSMYGLHN